MADKMDIVVPDLGEYSEVEIIEVLVSAGEPVRREDGLITLETDKATMDVPAPAHGSIVEITVAVGGTVSSGDVIGSMTVEDVPDNVVQQKPTGTKPLSEPEPSSAAPIATPTPTGVATAIRRTATTSMGRRSKRSRTKAKTTMRMRILMIIMMIVILFFCLVMVIVVVMLEVLQQYAGGEKNP